MGSLEKDFDQGTTGRDMGRIRIEEVTSTNLSLLRDINQKIFPILTVTNMSDNQWSQFVKKDSGFAFLAYWNDMLAGAVCCQLTDNNGLYLRFIGTLNRHRRKGVAKKLMQRVLQEAQERDVHNIISYVRNDNKAAIHINQKFGFGITSNDKGPESLRDGEDAPHQQPCTCLCLRLRDNLETIFDSTGLNWLGPPIMGKNTHNLKTTFGFCWKNFTKKHR